MSFILLGIAFSGHLISLPDEAVDKGFFGAFLGAFFGVFLDMLPSALPYL